MELAGPNPPEDTPDAPAPAPDVASADGVAAGPTSCRSSAECAPDQFCASGRCRADAVGIAAGCQHTCVVLADATARCWGDNEFGQVGSGHSTDHSTPAVVAGLAGASSVVGSSRNSCALVRGGVTACWGAPAIGPASGVSLSRTPSPAAALAGAVQLAPGDRSGCAIFGAGRVACWGDNSAGQLGNGKSGDFLFVESPMDVVDLGGAATGLSAGLAFNCALVAGSVRCWGSNGAGQLGDGSMVSSPRPVTVSGISGATALVSGRAHSCALLAGGLVRCWGENTGGQLGNGTMLDSPQPVGALGLTGVSAIAAGSGATCAIAAEGTVWCWGSGGAIPDEGYAPLPDPVSGVSGARALAVGCSHACALMADGDAICWGANMKGQLGVGGGGTIVRYKPTLVAPW
jgi:alpha-tubulin suppressor-like RCC1 family protein